MKRNLLYLENKFKNNEVPAISFIKGVVEKYLKQCLLYNGEFWKTRFYLKKAKADFEKGIMGKIKEVH